VEDTTEKETETGAPENPTTTLLEGMTDSQTKPIDKYVKKANVQVLKGIQKLSLSENV